MAERYTKVFSLSENRYTETCPIIIEAGALLKDNSNNTLVGQLKFRNIDSRVVKAITVSLELKDSAERLIGKTVEYKYLDFNAGRDAEFGQKTPIPINNNESRAFDVSIKEIVFANNEVWSSPENASWTNIPKQQPLSSKIADSELRKQFRLDINSKAEYAYFAPLDLWCCCCGAINHKGEENCHLCKKPEKLSRNIDLTSLKKASKTRLAKIKAEQEERDKEYRERKEQEAQQKELQKAQQKEQIKKVGAIAGIAIAFVAVILLITKVIIPFAQYSSAVKLMNNGKYEEAIAKFEELNGYKDSADHIDNCHYNLAIELMNNGEYQEAKDIFVSLDGYKDSNELSAASSVWYLKDASVGDIVTFGNYKGNSEWIVLNKVDGGIFVISKNAIDQIPYNTKRSDATWDICTLRDWLNGVYFTSAFNDDEQRRIIRISVSNRDKEKYYAVGSDDTMDKVFLLSIDEVEKYFASDLARQTALADGTNVWWWLRSMGYYSTTSVAFVDSDGAVDKRGNFAYSRLGGVRPAMWIDTSDL